MYIYTIRLNIETSACINAIMSHRAGAVASRAIELALQGEPFRVTDVQRGLSDPPSRQTIYRVLRQLEADDWITIQDHTWYPDIKAKGLGDVDDQDDRERRRGFSVDAEDLLE